MIKLVRVDHRLLHGQVVYRWLKALDVDCILIANDSVVKDDLRMSALRMAKPESCKIVFKSVDDSISALNSGVTDKYKLLVILESIEDAYKLAKGVTSIKYINLGGAKIADGKKQISKAVFVSQDDINKIKELNADGVKQEIQMIPDDKPEDVMSLL